MQLLHRIKLEKFCNRKGGRMTSAADLNAQTTSARITQATATGASGRSTRSRKPIGKPPATAAEPVAEVAVKTIAGGPSAYRVKHGTSDDQVIAEVREYAQANEWKMDLTDQEILDAIGWVHLPGSAVKRIRPLVAVAAA
jgi:hypothetical protein